MRFNKMTCALILGAGALTGVADSAIADGYTAAPPAAVVTAEPARGPCYVRADVGYGWSASSNASATVSPNGFGTTSGRVQESSLNGSRFGELGFGCSIVRQSTVGGSIKDQPVTEPTPTGLRGDIAFGFYGHRSYSGVPVSPPTIDDPVHASVQANTLMFNLYYDLPQRHGLIPYVGAGIGMAFVDLKNTTFTNGFVVQPGNVRETNLAWSLMAGASTDIGHGIMLDAGYRYLNMGDISVSNPSLGYGLKLHDLAEHQVKVGLRFPIAWGQ